MHIRQTDTRALKPIRCVQPLEYTKKLVGVLHVESSAIVADIKFQLGGKIFAPHPNFSVLAFTGIFDRIGQQIPEHLHNQAAITLDFRQGRYVKRHLAARKFALKTRDHLTDDRIQVGHLELQSVLAEAGKTQQIVDEPLQSDHVFLNPIHVAKTGGSELPRVFFMQDFREGGNVAQWSADIMGNRIAECFERLVAFFQLGHADIEFRVETANFLLGAPPVGDVAEKGVEVIFAIALHAGD